MSTAMNHLTVDEQVLQVLQQAKGPTEIRDLKGNLFGIFTPTRMTEEEIRKHFDLEKAKRVAREERGQGKTTAEVLAHLRSLAPEQ